MRPSNFSVNSSKSEPSLQGGALHLLAIQYDEMQTIYGIKGNLKNTDDNHCLMLRCNFSVKRSKSAPSVYVYCSPNDSVRALQLANKVQNKAPSQKERKSEPDNKFNLDTTKKIKDFAKMSNSDFLRKSQLILDIFIKVRCHHK